MKPISAIAFDLDNTLVDRDKAFHRLLVDWFQVVIGGSGYLIDCVLELDYHGHGSRDDLFASLEKMNILGEEAEIRERFCDEFPRYFEPNDLLNAMLQKFVDKGIKLAILANGGTDLQKGKTTNAGLTPFFKDELILISEQISFAKPDPIAFEILSHKLQCEPEEILFVGDHPVLDIRGASSAGFQTCWLYKEYYGPPVFDSIIHDILELENVVFSP